MSHKIGTMLKNDKLASLHDRCLFSHICVELRGERLFIEYEGLHVICFKCGKYGPKKRTNVESLWAKIYRNNRVSELKAALKKQMMKVMKNTPLGRKGKEAANIDKPLNTLEGQGLGFGPWNIRKRV